MRSMLDRKSLLCGMIVVAVTAACVPPAVSGVVGTTCAMCSVFDTKAAVPSSAKAVSASTRAVISDVTKTELGCVEVYQFATS